MGLEIGGLVLFGLIALAQQMSPDWTAANALWLSFAGLGAISFISVACGRPWTADYSRAAYPDNAGTPQFKIINAGITALWGMLFLAIGICSWFGVPELVTSAIVVLGALISIFGPRLAIGYALKRMMDARETYRWPAPDFGCDATTDCDVAVVGAGIGGLTAAAPLADAGLKVRVLAFRDRVAQAPPANSAFSVHLGLDVEPDILPATHIDAPVGVGLAMMSKLDPSAAPPGHATLTLTSLVSNAKAQAWFPPEGREDWRDWRRSDEYEARKQERGDAMIAAADTIIPDLSKHIVYRTVASPVTYVRYDWASAGAIYGISREGRLKGWKSPVRNLVIAGGGNAGAGVEAVVISGAEAALVPGLLSRAKPGPATEGTSAMALSTA